MPELSTVMAANIARSVLEPLLRPTTASIMNVWIERIRMIRGEAFVVFDRDVERLGEMLHYMTPDTPTALLETAIQRAGRAPAPAPVEPGHPGSEHELEPSRTTPTYPAPVVHLPDVHDADADKPFLNLPGRRK